VAIIAYLDLSNRILTMRVMGLFAHLVITALLDLIVHNAARQEHISHTLGEPMTLSVYYANLESTAMVLV
jgi:hypothetical protein